MEVFLKDLCEELRDLASALDGTDKLKKWQSDGVVQLALYRINGIIDEVTEEIVGTKKEDLEQEDKKQEELKPLTW